MSNLRPLTESVRELDLLSSEIIPKNSLKTPYTRVFNDEITEKIIKIQELENGNILNEFETIFHSSEYAFLGICLTFRELDNEVYYSNTTIRKKGKCNKIIADLLTKKEKEIINDAPAKIASVGCFERHKNGLIHKHSLLICRKKDYEKVYLWLKRHIPKQGITEQKYLNFRYVLKQRKTIGKVAGVQEQKELIYLTNSRIFDKICLNLTKVAVEYWQQFQNRKNKRNKTTKDSVINRTTSIRFVNKTKKVENQRQININGIETSEGKYHFEAKGLLTEKEFKKLKSKSRNLKSQDKKTARKILLGWATYFARKRVKITPTPKPKKDIKSTKNERGQATIVIDDPPKDFDVLGYLGLLSQAKNSDSYFKTEWS
ncbi:hypothetical protein O6B72_06080 [Campylobacter ureolyticus]|uniref:hypothetical protein n=1 Tax=Campylobacter ureolyticus TaxID=827 RepID=UPI0022B388D6|nr:hypothetical protein [Campylobacter ureolyticus]MCZ6156382.1 hypothetical protein [Campylobacter ureolyticus]